MSRHRDGLWVVVIMTPASGLMVVVGKRQPVRGHGVPATGHGERRVDEGTRWLEGVNLPLGWEHVGSLHHTRENDAISKMCGS